jgi:diguanylate cyclase (GGDEF)-like protein/PAS domain S-box-containing protein
VSETDEAPRAPLLLTADDLSGMLGYIDEAILCCDDAGTITFVSPGIRHILGIDPASMVGRNVVDFVHPDNLTEVVEGLARWAGRRGSPRGEVIRLTTADGGWRAVRYDSRIGDLGALGSYSFTLAAAGEVDSQARELRSRIQHEERVVRLASAFLEVRHEDFDKGLDNALEALAALEWITRVSVWVTDPTRPDRMLLRASWTAPANAPATALPDKVRISDSPVLSRLTRGEEVRIVGPWSDDDEDGMAQYARQSEVVSLLSFPMMSDGTCIGAVTLSSTLMNVAYEATHASMLRAGAAIISQALVRHEAEARLAVQARTDRVTGLGNRWAFEESIERALASVASGRSPGFGLALLDLDGFKVVNDAHGHAVGDRLLVDIAHRLRSAADDRTVLSRLGGDELLVLFDDAADRAEVLDRLQTLLLALRVPFDTAGTPHVLTASVGVVHATDASMDGGELLRRADVAMFRAKARGGDLVVLDDPTDRSDEAILHDREQQLRRAVADGDIDVHFQGEWDLATGALRGAEALARWEHPTEGLLAAGTFIPLAEAIGVIGDLGLAVLRRACTAAAPWVAALGPGGFVLRVNVAAAQLGEHDLVERIDDILADSGFPPAALCLELTESTLLADPAAAATQFERLRARGIGLAIDDFGTGYSSIAQLKDLPLTALKIDRSFVEGLPEDPVDRAIVQATIEMARALSLDVTAEGVETPEQRDALVALGCTHAQGFLLARPEPVEAFARRVQESLPA